MSIETNNTYDDIKKSSVEQSVAVDNLTILIIMLTFSFLVGIAGISLYCLIMRKKRKKLLSESPYSGTALDTDSYIRYGSPGYYRKPDLEVPSQKYNNRRFSELSSVSQMANEILLTEQTHYSITNIPATIEDRLNLPSLECDNVVKWKRSSTKLEFKERNSFNSSQFRISCSNVPDFSDSILAHDEEVRASCIKKSPSLTPLFTPCDGGIVCSTSTLTATNPDFVSADFPLKSKFVSSESNLVSELNSCQSTNQVIEGIARSPSSTSESTVYDSTIPSKMINSNKSCEVKLHAKVECDDAVPILAWDSTYETVKTPESPIKLMLTPRVKNVFETLDDSPQNDEESLKFDDSSVSNISLTWDYTDEKLECQTSPHSSDVSMKSVEFDDLVSRVAPTLSHMKSKKLYVESSQEFKTEGSSPTLKRFATSVDVIGLHSTEFRKRMDESDIANSARCESMDGEMC